MQDCNMHSHMGGKQCCDLAVEHIMNKNMRGRSGKF